MKLKLPIYRFHRDSQDQTRADQQRPARRGLKVPQDLSVVCYGDRNWYELVFGGLTAVRLPEEEIARTCIDLLFTQPPRLEGIVLLPELVERRSVADASPPAAQLPRRSGNAR
jgi:hypothetical protein